jgi:sulfatase maturation enzyme AslB (radical SAM superfamily)
MRCTTCEKWKTPQGVQDEELNAEEWKAIMLNLKQWMGKFSFIFSGGEPFLREDIFELISFAVNSGLQPRIISNGCGFSFLAERIVTSGLESLVVSLNGLRASTHDFTRGVKGAHSKTLQFIKDVNSQRKRLKTGMRLSIQTILMPFNCEEAADLVRWVKEERVDGIQFQPLDLLGSFHSYHAINSAPVKGVNNDWYRNALVDAASSVKLDGVIKELVAQKRQGYQIYNSLEQLNWIRTYYRRPKELLHMKCRIGVSSLNVDPYGDVRLCFDMKPIGNMRTATPRQLYNNRIAIEQRRLIKKCNRSCHWLLFSNG